MSDNLKTSWFTPLSSPHSNNCPFFSLCKVLETGQRTQYFVKAVFSKGPIF